MLEIVAKLPAGSDKQSGERKRRFVVQLMNSGNAFTLVEENADREFGALYFSRGK